MNHQPLTTGEGIAVSLVHGDADVRHARQLMLRSQQFDVRSYATCAGLLGDLRAQDYHCIVLDLVSDDLDGVALLVRMRATGWCGRAILLNGDDPGGAPRRDVERFGDRVLAHAITDGDLLSAIAASVDRRWTGWQT